MILFHIQQATIIQNRGDIVLGTRVIKHGICVDRQISRIERIVPVQRNDGDTT